MILLPPSDKSHSPPSQMLFMPYWAPTCFRCLLSPRPLWLVFNSSLSQCLFLYLRWTMLIFFYLRKKGQKGKGTISQSSHPLLFCSVCSYHLQVPKKQINCCSSPWPRPCPISSSKFLFLIRYFFPFSTPYTGKMRIVLTEAMSSSWCLCSKGVPQQVW